MAFIAHEWRIFADKKRVSDEGVYTSSSYNDNFLSYTEVMNKELFFCIFFLNFLKFIIGRNRVPIILGISYFRDDCIFVCH